MTLTDYLIDISLIGLVLVQVKRRRLTVKALVLPLGIVAYVAFTYLKGIPTAHNDLVLIVGATVIGATLGGLAGTFTSVTRGADGVFAKAGLAAAGLWILGTGGRLAFQVWASHGGGPDIARFSATHGITSVTAWTSALILMALAEATVRTGVLGWRSGLLSPAAAQTLGRSRTPGRSAHIAVPPVPQGPAASASFPPVRSRTAVPSGLGSMMDSSDIPRS
jgi:hypothetical protein